MNNIGISFLDYQLPNKSHTLKYLEENNLLNESANTLSKFGFARCYIEEHHNIQNLANGVIEKILRQIDFEREKFDYFFMTNAILQTDSVSNQELDMFSYPIARLQYNYSINNAKSIALSQAGCASFLSSINIARDMIRGNSDNNYILCVGGDVLPKKSKRDLLYNLVSDASCAVVIQRNSPANKIISYTQTTKSSFWDVSKSKDHLLATYFPTAANNINRSLAEANLSPSDIKYLIPHNVSINSWHILAEMVGFEKEQLFLDNISKIGHTTQADPIINLKHLIESGKINKGDKLLIFTFGFGAHWASLILEY